MRILLGTALVVLVGCKSSEPAPPRVSVASVASVAPSTTETPRPRGLCATDENLVFGCSISNGKQFSLCSTAETMRLVYRFGRPERIELEYPDAGVAPGAAFTYYAWTGRALSNRQEVSFRNGDAKYTIIDGMEEGPGWDWPRETPYVSVQGLEVRVDGKEPVNIKCTGNVAGIYEEQSLATLANVLPHQAE